MSIQINVDPTNPGQFFACCGLHELAYRFWPGAEGWFEQGRFRIACAGTLATLLDYLATHEPAGPKELENGLAVKSIIAPLRFVFEGGSGPSLTVDTWTQTRIEKGKPTVLANPPWNFWSGNQTTLKIWRGLRLALLKQLPQLRRHDEASLFGWRVPLTGRFGFDPGAAWNALDVGFSPNTLQMPVASSPATEMLAAIGIQRFRPLLSDDRRSFLYATWGLPLLPSAAAAVASSLVVIKTATRFRGYIVDRGQYAALGYSMQLKGLSDARSTDAV